MENPEDVLQALDEFQKMRPSEIPRELEEYLSWVAKTGDPVYQWSLVKPLFREKLTRVMTDFYESCPSLELAACPNVEQFNYDIMKCNLLELLESFANAPFTVQRICELLTSPRKQYNRVDKFMRAIEKNILVVSTIEPGAAARRSENGDGMVNGSLEDETSGGQASREADMESWVKDCASENDLATTGREDKISSAESHRTIVKPAGATSEEISRIAGKCEETNERAEIADSESVSRVVVANEQAASSRKTDEAKSRPESKPADGSETTTTTTSSLEMPEAVMNEDTSSQPSLDAETEASDGTSGGRKLQTTFRSADFLRADEKSVATYDEMPKSETEKRKIVDDSDSRVDATNGDDTTPRNLESGSESRESVAIVVDGSREKRARLDGPTDDADTIAADRSEEVDSPSRKKASSSLETKTEDPASFTIASASTGILEDEKTTEATLLSEDKSATCENEKIGHEEEEEEDEDDEDDVAEETKKEEMKASTDDSLPDAAECPTSDTTNDPKPIIEEPRCDEIGEETPRRRESGVTIEEAMEDDTRIDKSIIPDPIPIIEEPKESEPSIRDPVIATIITEMPEDTLNSTDITEIRETSEDNDSAAVAEEDNTIETIDERNVVVAAIGQDDITDVRCPEVTSNDEKNEPAESMEIDGDESLPAFQRDEPMDQESGDTIKS